MQKSLEGLFKAKGIKFIRGNARIIAPGFVEISGAQGEQTLPFDNLLIATGSRPANIPGAPPGPFHQWRHNHFK
jgi:Pyruvate/2-oxoglutarate dehydrogenase complex, dihydrolipoamide dehydrogenase (E3) component, and related enzymes